MSRQSAIDITGKTFGLLTVVQRAGSRQRANKKPYATWLCRCTCGQEVVVVGQRLRRGLRTACAIDNHRGYSRPDTLLAKRYRSEFGSWTAMRERCYSPRKGKYLQYGGRGITICDRWKDSFGNFLSDMGPKPTPDHTIERNDVNGNYEPSNCRWATRAEQSRNIQKSVYVEYEGERLLFIDLRNSQAPTQEYLDPRPYFLSFYSGRPGVPRALLLWRPHPELVEGPRAPLLRGPRPARVPENRL